jgi:hypothetical protein
VPETDEEDVGEHVLASGKLMNGRMSRGRKDSKWGISGLARAQ